MVCVSVCLCVCLLPNEYKKKARFEVNILFLVFKKKSIFFIFDWQSFLRQK